ncbi:MAG: GNAT family protein [Polyangiales bacterium]
MSLRLRELRRSDLGALNRWRHDRRVIDGLGTHYAYVAPEVDDAWFSAYLSDRQRNVRLVILDDELAAADEPIGCVYLLSINWVHRHAEFAIMIGREDCRGRGLGLRATAAMLAHAFRDLGLQRVWLHVHAQNTAARHVYERAGFKLEGTLRSALYKDGAFLDVHVMGILAHEHTPPQPAQ